MIEGAVPEPSEEQSQTYSGCVPSDEPRKRELFLSLCSGWEERVGAIDCLRSECPIVLGSQQVRAACAAPGKSDRVGNIQN